MARGEYTLTYQEANNIFNSIYDLRNRLICKLLYFYGLRESEILSERFRIPDIDKQRKTLVIRNSKFGKTAVIPTIDMQTWIDLMTYIGNRIEGPVFDKLKVRQHVNYIVEKAGKEAGVLHPDPTKKNRKLNPHLFRHSIARHLKNVGYSLEFIQKFMRHTSYKTTMDVYGTLNTNEMQRMIANKTGDSNLMPKIAYVPEIIRER